MNNYVLTMLHLGLRQLRRVFLSLMQEQDEEIVRDTTEQHSNSDTVPGTFRSFTSQMSNDP